MILEQPPFRRRITPTTSSKNPRGRLASYRHKLNVLIVLQDIVIPVTWRGASEIVATFGFTPDVAMSFFDNVPTDPNYCACIAWKPTSETIVRYKLWEDVGEILYVDLYAGQTIGPDARIEIWNTKDSVTATIEGFRLKTSELIIPTCSCDHDDHISSITFIQCTDTTMDLTGWNPSVGDYYLVIGCGVTEIVSATRYSSLILRCVDDGTWHEFSLFSFGGITAYLIDQNNHAAGTKDYFPLLDGTTAYRLELTLAAGLYTIKMPPDTVIDPDAVVFVQLLSTDGFYYLLSLNATDDDIVIDQTPIV